MTGALLILLGLGGLLFLARSKGLAPTQTSAQEAALLEPGPDGTTQYRAEVRPTLVQALKTKSVKPDSSDPLLTWLIEEAEIVDMSKSAFLSAKGLHEAGYNLWVTPTLMTPAAQKKGSKRAMYATLPGNKPPEKYSVVLLWSYADGWTIDDQVPPAPPPDAPPPPPPGA